MFGNQENEIHYRNWDTGTWFQEKVKIVEWLTSHTFRQKLSAGDRYGHETQYCDQKEGWVILSDGRKVYMSIRSNYSEVFNTGSGTELVCGPL